MNESKLKFTVGIIFIFFILNLIFIKDKRNHDDEFSGTASFNRIDGLLIGSEVRLSGVIIGKVSEIFLDQNKPSVSFSLRKDIMIPSDSSISIQTDGLFGSKYLSVEPGGSFDYIKNGEEILFTEDSILIEELLGRIISIGENKL